MLWRMSIPAVLLVVTGMSGCGKDQQQKDAAAPAAPVVVIQEPERDGVALFKQYCAACHPNGGNVSDPERSLRGSVLKKRHITTPEDIVRIMRNPLSRMIRFDAATVSDKDARVIAEYILITFK
jgi:cytochrome c6